MSTALVDAVARLLAAEGVGAYSTTDALPQGSVPITLYAMPQGQGDAIAVSTYAGPEPDTRNEWEYPRLQVRVRATNPLDALSLDRAAYDVLQTAKGALPGGTWSLTDAYALQSAAQPLGLDANGRHEYVRNYQLSTHRTS